jgi:hypothetical protein
VSDKLPAVRPRQLIRALERAGWERERTRGSRHLPLRPALLAYHVLRQVEYQQQCVFDAAELVVGEVSDVLAERACVDGADHLA